MKVSLAFIGMFLATAAIGAAAQDDDTNANVADLVEQAISSADLKDGPSPWDWPGQPPVAAQIVELPSTLTDNSTVSKRSIDPADDAYWAAVAIKLATPDRTEGLDANVPEERSLDPEIPGRFNRGNSLGKRDDYYTLTDGNNPVYSNAALQSTSYLTYKVISNTTSYADAKRACTAYCDSISRCTTANMYQEVGNPLLDHVFSEKSNRKCALFGDALTLSKMTNKGGQQLYGRSSPANYIKNSAVFTLAVPRTLPVPTGYDFGWGPINAALPQEPWGGIGWKYLSAYDPQVCATTCTNNRYCKFFNIWTEKDSNGEIGIIWCDLWGQNHGVADAVFKKYSRSSVTAANSRGYSRRRGT